MEVVNSVCCPIVSGRKPMYNCTLCKVQGNVTVRTTGILPSPIVDWHSKHFVTKEVSRFAK